MHDAPESPLCENATSSTKPEVHDVSQRHQKRTKQRHICGTNTIEKRCISTSAFMQVCLLTSRHPSRQQGYSVELAYFSYEHDVRLSVRLSVKKVVST